MREHPVVYPKNQGELNSEEPVSGQTVNTALVWVDWLMGPDQMIGAFFYPDLSSYATKIMYIMEL